MTRAASAGQLVFVLREGPRHVPLQPRERDQYGDTLRQLRWRYATKQFDPGRKIDSSTFWTVAACPAGYRAEEDKHSALPKVRFEKTEIINYLP